MNLLETYPTVQGEGPNVGQRTLFVRFGGCNMRCPGWPCDTPYSIYPEQWKKEIEVLGPEEVYRRIVDETRVMGINHVCITGGEPLIQPAESINRLFELLISASYTIDLFTNGSRNFARYLVTYPRVSIIMDWKLIGSGEGTSFLDIRTKNLTLLNSKDAVKFVVKDEVDLEQARQIHNKWGRTPFRQYISPAWGEIQPHEIVAYMDEHGLEDMWLNLQTHKYIFDPAARRI